MQKDSIVIGLALIVLVLAFALALGLNQTFRGVSTQPQTSTGHGVVYAFVVQPTGEEGDETAGQAAVKGVEREV